MLYSSGVAQLTSTLEECKVVPSPCSIFFYEDDVSIKKKLKRKIRFQLLILKAILEKKYLNMYDYRQFQNNSEMEDFLNICKWSCLCHKCQIDGFSYNIFSNECKISITWTGLMLCIDIKDSWYRTVVR